MGASNSNTDDKSKNKEPETERKKRNDVSKTDNPEPKEEPKEPKRQKDQKDQKNLNAIEDNKVKEKQKNGVRMVAVLPQNTDEAIRYLESHQIKVDQVLNASLSSIGVTGTPTLMLVNEDGVVSEFWRGKLNEEKQAEVSGPNSVKVFDVKRHCYL